MNRICWLAIGKESQSLARKWRDEAFLSGFAFLKKAAFDADHFRKGKEAFVFLFRDLAVDILKGGIGLDLGHGGVLIHNADQYVISKRVMEVTQHAFGFADLSGKEEVAHNHAANHQSRGIIKDGIPNLAVHFIQREGCLFKIVWTVRESGCRSAGAVFEIGKKDVDQTFQRAERFDFLVAAGIIDNGQGETLLFCCDKCKTDLRYVMRGRDQIDIVGTLFLELQKDPGESFHADGFALISKGNLTVLTVYAA